MNQYLLLCEDSVKLMLNSYSMNQKEVAYEEMGSGVVFVGVLSVLTLALSGCTYYRPYHGAPLASLDGVEVVGTTESEACQHFFLCIPVGGENTLKKL